LLYDNNGAYIRDAEADQQGKTAALPLNDRAIARLRGWRKLTGSLGLSEEEAVNYQDEIGCRLVACWNALRGVPTDRLELLGHHLRGVLLEVCSADPEVRDAAIGALRNAFEMEEE
jgi:hypothetical protein